MKRQSGGDHGLNLKHRRGPVPWLVAGAMTLGFAGCGNDLPEPPPGQEVVVENGCYNCHGMRGISDNPRFPNLAGQKQEYLVNQLMAFRSAGEGVPDGDPMAKRFNTMMSAKAKSLSDDDIQAVTQYYASRDCLKHPAGPPEDPPQMVYRCARCHGKNGISTYPLVPNLAGQNRVYLEIQFEAIKNGQEVRVEEGDVTVRRHPMMARQIEGLSEGDQTELARYYSKLDCAPRQMPGGATKDAS